MQFDSNLQNFSGNEGSVVSEDALKARFQKKSLFTFQGYLARKGGEKSYTSEKQKVYGLNWFGVLMGNGLRISAAFMSLFLLIKGLFSITGDAAAYIAGAITLVALVALEYMQYRNATELYERWFFKDKFTRSNIMYALLYSAITLGLSLWGVGDTVKALSKAVSPLHFDERTVNPTLSADITKLEIERAEFYKARSWKGKLDPKDGAEYKRMGQELSEMRKALRDEISTAKINAQTAYDAKLAEKEHRDGDNTFYAILCLILAEILFWVCMYHKERYEFLSYQEAVLAGKIGQNAPSTLSVTHPIAPQNSYANGHSNGHAGRPQNGVRVGN